MRKLSLFTIAGLTLVALACSLSAARADYIFDVSIDTSGLSSDTNLTGPFGIDFEMFSGGVDSGNSATISNFTFVGGGSLTLSSSGNLGTNGYYDSSSSTINLAVDNGPNFFSDFNVGFTPGAQLTFQVKLSTNVGSTPDSFSLYLLENYSPSNLQNGTSLPIPTTDTISSTLLTIGITSSTPPIQTYGGVDPNDPITTNATPLPEPGTLVLSLLALGSLAMARGWRRLRRTKADLGELLV